MSAPSHRLAEALARRLNAVAPAGFLISADGEHVVVRTDSGICCQEGTAMILADEDSRTMGEKIETATWQVLSGVQDCLVRELGERWPASSGPGGLPLPEVRVLDETVRFRFSEEGHPVLTFAPIRLDEMVPSD